MPATYTLRPKADKDVDAISNDLAERASLGVALHFLKNAYDSFTLLASQPQMGWPCRLRRPSLAAVRVFRVSKPFEKYLFFYLYLEDHIEIIRIIHGAQDLEQILFEE